MSGKAKFWQVVFVLSQWLDTPSLKQTLDKVGDHRLIEWADNYDTIVSTLNREILDAELPDALVSELLRNVSEPFSLADGWLRLGKDALRLGIAGGRLTPLEAFKSFGMQAIVDVIEYGSTNVGSPA